MTFPYALIDWDNTISRGYTIYRLTDYLLDEGAVPESLIREFDRLRITYRLGDLAYSVYTERTCETFAAALAGCSADAYRQAVSAFLPRNEHALIEDAEALFDLLRRYGIAVYLVSGAPSDVLRAYARRFGIRGLFGFELEESATGILTGRVVCNYGLDKERALDRPIFRDPGAIHLLSMGDADADVPLLNRARIPIVAGGSSLRLRDGADPLHFAESPWDLKRLEERIVKETETSYPPCPM